MKRLCIWVWVLLSGLLTLQAQERSDEIQPHAPRILGLDCSGGSYDKLTSLEVIGCTSLTSLNCMRNDLKSLDVSGCTSLTSLDCSANDLTSLDVSGCISLKRLNKVRVDTLKIHGVSMDTLGLSEGRIRVLDVMGCMSLKNLSCGGIELSSLDVRGCTLLASLDCSRNQLSSLDVSGCTSLTSLDCSVNELSSLDVSGCTSLAYLSCYSNQLSSLDVSGCTSLTSLNCRSNRLSSLDVSGCTSLVSLFCHYNGLTSLDVSGCTLLKKLDIDGMYTTLKIHGVSMDTLSLSGRVAVLDARGCTSLVSLSCNSNQLGSLDVSGCISLASLSCNSNQLGSLDVSGCTSLASLSCNSNQLGSLDVSGCTSLASLDCSKNQLSSLDVSGCTSLKELRDVRVDTLKIYGESMDTLTIKSTNGYTDASYYIGVLDAAGSPTLQQITCTPYWESYDHKYYGTIRRLNLQGCTSLRRLSCSNNDLSSLDVSGCTSLTSLDCEGNVLTSLDVSGCTSLTSLDCEGNVLTSLDVSGCTSLTSLDCRSNYWLSSLYVSGCTSLINLNCRSNRLSSLDVSGCTSLTSLDCGGNVLTSLDVSGCISLKKLEEVMADTLKIHGMAMDTLYAPNDGYDNYNYNSINVVDAKGCTSLVRLDCKGGDRVGPLRSLDVSGCTSLVSLNCSYNQLISLDVSGCTSLTSLSCSRNALTSLDVSGCTSLTSLDCSGSDYSSGQLSSLNVSGCTSLTSLYCGNNRLTELDVSGCTALTSLNCSGCYPYGQLSSLNVSGCTALTSLSCSRNALTSLDVSKNTSLTSLSCSCNALTSLDVSKNTTLRSLDCSSNQLSILDVSKNTTLTSLDCGSNRLSSLDVSKNTVLTSLNCNYNRIPLSVLYKAYSQNSNWEEFEVDNQSDSTTILINRPFDLSSERIVGQTLTTFILKDGYNRDVASDFWTENKFVFQFHEPLNYKLSLENKVVGSGGESFTWYISVVEEMPVRYFTVQVSSNNAGWGTATITGNGTYEEGTEVTVTASSKEGYRFINWTRKDGSGFSTEAVHTFTVSENAELTANFEKLPEDVETFTVAVAANNAEWGRVSQTGDGTYEKDEEVTITAKANAGYRFVDWTKKDGTVFSIESVHTFAVTENMELTANFERLPDVETFTVNLSSNNTAWGIVSLVGNSVCERGEAVTIIATPMMGCRFINWTRKDGSVFSTEAVHTFTVTENLELTANFKQNVANESHEDDDFYVYVQEHTIHLSAERGEVQVYNAAGVCVYRGWATAIPVKSSGLYIVRVGERAYKAMVR